MLRYTLLFCLESHISVAQRLLTEVNNSIILDQYRYSTVQYSTEAAHGGQQLNHPGPVQVQYSSVQYRGCSLRSTTQSSSTSTGTVQYSTVQRLLTVVNNHPGPVRIQYSTYNMYGG